MRPAKPDRTETWENPPNEILHTPGGAGSYGDLGGETEKRNKVEQNGTLFGGGDFVPFAINILMAGDYDEIGRGARVALFHIRGVRFCAIGEGNPPFEFLHATGGVGSLKGGDGRRVEPVRFLFVPTRAGLSAALSL
jgi:hypothetical protein